MEDPPKVGIGTITLKKEKKEVDKRKLPWRGKVTMIQELEGER